MFQFHSSHSPCSLSGMFIHTEGITTLVQAQEPCFWFGLPSSCGHYLTLASLMTSLSFIAIASLTMVVYSGVESANSDKGRRSEFAVASSFRFMLVENCVGHCIKAIITTTHYWAIAPSGPNHWTTVFSQVNFYLQLCEKSNWIGPLQSAYSVAPMRNLISNT